MEKLFCCVMLNVLLRICLDRLSVILSIARSKLYYIQDILFELSTTSETMSAQTSKRSYMYVI
jgi:hypothetical protein